MFKRCYKQGYITQKELLEEVLMIPNIYGRLYLSALVTSQYIQQIQIQREKLYEDDDYVKKLRKLGFPQTQKELRNIIASLLEDITTYAIQMQDPLRHIFYRKFTLDAIQPYLDLEIDEEQRTFQTSKDYIMASNFLLLSYQEATRLFIRTQFEPERTKAEAARRDKKRQYLGTVLGNGYVELVNYCIYDAKRQDIIVEVITSVAKTEDSMASSILNQILEQLPAEVIAENLSKILYPLSQQTSGVVIFIQLAKRLQEANLITEKLFGKILKSGTVLCQTIIDFEKNNGKEETMRIIQLAGQFKSEVETPWLAIWKEIMSIASIVFGEDIEKLNYALTGVLSVMYQGIDDRVDELALRLKGQYVETEEQVAAEPQNTNDSQNSENNSENSNDSVSSEVKISNKFNSKKTSIDEFTCIEMNQEAEKSLLQVISAPLQHLDMKLVYQYLDCGSIVLIRHHLQSIDKIYDIRFCEEIAINLVRRPITLPTDQFILKQSELEAGNKILAECLIQMADDNPYEFSQSLHSSNCSKQIFDIYETNVKKPETSILAIPALFYSLLNDGHIKEAITVVDFMKVASSYQQPVMYFETAQLLLKIIKGDIKVDFIVDFEDLYKVYQKLIISFENAKSSEEQPTILKYLISLLMQCELPGGEEIRILKRFQAAIYNLLLRENQAELYVHLAAIYKKYLLDEEMNYCLEQAKIINEKYGTEQTKLLYSQALEDFQKLQ